MVQARDDDRRRLVAQGPERAGTYDDDGLVVSIGPMRRRHLRSVLRIEIQVCPRPWSLSLFMSELALRNSRVYYVARVDGAVVGYAGLMVTGEDAHITTIAVDPAWHRRTIGSRLLLTAVQEACRRGVTSISLEVRVGNRAAQEMYRRFGFQPAGVRKNYYVESNEDALVMWAHDVDQRDYQRLLAKIEAGLPGLTLVDESRPV